MDTAGQHHRRTDLFGEYLVSEHLINQEQLKAALDDAQDILAVYLVENNLITTERVAKALADYYDLPLYDLSDFDVTQVDKSLLEFDIVKHGRGFPIKIADGVMTFGVIDPSIGELQQSNTGKNCILDYVFHKKLKLEYVIVDISQLNAVLDQFNIKKTTSIAESIKDLTSDLLVDFDVGDIDIEEQSREALENLDHEETPIVHFVNKILLDAINSHSSDIHFEPFDKMCRVRYRQDGVLYEMVRPPKKLASSIVARLKVMSNLDISEHRIPQDGRFKIRLNPDRIIDFRVSTCPTLYGEKVVMRILDAESTPLNIDDLGMEPFQKKAYLEAISQSQGLILVTGPTGSGKTVSLYTALGILNTVEKNISTIEDPVEINMEGINQVQVNNKAGLTFASALRSFLRQDPDIVMVGEVRDLETAEIAVKASQTGHLVLSTLHTNSAPVTLARLSNMGVEPFNIASSVILVMAQRLLRRLCDHCKIKTKYDKEMLLEQGFKEDQLANLIIYEPGDGKCKQCSGGYKGRVGIYEVMPISSEMTEIIMQHGSSLDLERRAAKEGILNLRQSGLLKVMQGVSSLQELNRVIAKEQ